jgi:anti-sigma factor (TIGR02949 family)
MFMNVLNFKERSCERYRRYFDAYLDNELLVETNQDVLQHVASCADCNRILESRARIKQLVKETVTSESAPPELAAALRDRLRSERRSFFGVDTARWMMAAAAVLALAIGGFAVLDWPSAGRLRSEDGLFHTVSARVQDLLRVGLVDHVHCTILLQRWKRALSFDEMKAGTGATALGPEFIDLVPAVQAKLGADYKVVQGHRCTANHRHYVHLIVTGNQGAILSLVITKKENESFSETDAVAVMNASGIPVYRGRQGTLEVAGFESGQYLAYVVSNLDRDSNLNIAAAIAPLVSGHLSRIEG